MNIKESRFEVILEDLNPKNFTRKSTISDDILRSFIFYYVRVADIPPLNTRIVLIIYKRNTLAFSILNPLPKIIKIFI